MARQLHGRAYVLPGRPKKKASPRQGLDSKGFLKSVPSTYDAHSSSTPTSYLSWLTSPVTQTTTLDDILKAPAYSARMAKKQGAGGASSRGSHKLSNAGGCEVEYYYADIMGLEATKENVYTGFGTLLHSAMAYFYVERMERKPQWYVDFPDAKSAIEADAKGHNDWLRKLDELMKAYQRFEAGDPWNPIYCEEEIRARVGDLHPEGEDEPAIEFEYQGDCSGYDETKWVTSEATTSTDALSATTTPPQTHPRCAHWEVDVLGEDYVHIPHKTTRVKRMPRLNDEVVTCRPDLIIQRNGMNWIIDHKTAGGSRKKGDEGRLAVINPNYPDYTYRWQAMFNLQVCRLSMPIEGFIFNRVKRDIPFDFSRDIADVPERMYQKIPRVIRTTVKKERALIKKALTSPGDLDINPWECQGKYTCDFARLCYADSVGVRNEILGSEFRLK